MDWLIGLGIVTVLSVVVFIATRIRGKKSSSPRFGGGGVRGDSGREKDDKKHLR